MIRNFKNEKGFSVVEIMVVAAIITVSLTALLGVASFSLKILDLAQENTEAIALAQEMLETVRNFRDETDWDVNGLGTLAVAVDYYPQKSGLPLSWSLVLGTEIINGFTRKIVFENVMRDSNDDIVESGGVNDPDTKKVITTISWKDKQVEVITFLTNWNQQ